MTNISFKDAGDYAGTEDRDLLWHSLNQVEGGYQVVDEEDALDAIAWNSFRDAVKEHVRLHHRGGVHAIPGGGEYIETDEEFAYNGRIRVLAMRQDDVSRSPESVTLHIDLPRARVREALKENNRPFLDFAIDTLAIWNNAFWGQTPWHTRISVLDGSADLDPIEGHQPRIIRQAQHGD